MNVDSDQTGHRVHFGLDFLSQIPTIQAIQLVKNEVREKTYPNGIEIRNLIKWLTTLSLSE